MEKITSAGPESKSRDITAQNIEQLKALFPDVFFENKIDFEALKAVLGENIDDSQERYHFTWNGKNKARQFAQTPSTGTLRPCRQESIHWDSTENLFIEGDNLEVLKLLQKSYHKKVKMIYIDPPYNTGKDSVYKDNFHDNIKNYLELTGQVDGEGNKLSTNSDTSGRYHSHWLNMMYPRLKLARNLLMEEGVIFISIDDSEEHHLKLICNELFGESNYIGSIIWERAYAPINLKKHLSESHDYILCFAKNIDTLPNFGIERDQQGLDRYKNPDNDYRGPWTSNDLSVGPAVEEKIYDITTPSGRKINPPDGYCWRLTKARYQAFLKDNRIWFGFDGNNVPRIKRFLSEVKQTVTPMTIWKHEDVEHSQSATQNLKKLFGDKSVFSYPKPVNLIKRLIEISTKEDDLILDFFAGSGTTAHATIKMNKQKKTSRKFILIQLPELIPDKSEALKQGFKTIADICKERIRRAMSHIDQGNIKSGFRAFKLDQSNMRPWEADFNNVEKSLLNAKESIKADRTDEDVLYEILLKYGIELTVPVEQQTVDGRQVFVVGSGALLVCLDDDITPRAVEGIAQLKNELDPETTQVVFKDAGFADSVVKTNATMILKQAGIDDVKSI